MKNWTKIDEYKVKDERGSEVVFGTYVPNIGFETNQTEKRL